MGDRWKSHTRHPLSVGVIKKPARIEDKSPVAKTDGLERERWGPLGSLWVSLWVARIKFLTYSVKFQKENQNRSEIDWRKGPRLDHFKCREAGSNPVAVVMKVLPYTQMFHIHVHFQPSKHLLQWPSVQLPISQRSIIASALTTATNHVREEHALMCLMKREWELWNVFA